MRRREFIAGLGGVWPLVAIAQQPELPVVGYLDQYAAEPTGTFVAAFRKHQWLSMVPSEWRNRHDALRSPRASRRPDGKP